MKRALGALFLVWTGVLLVAYYAVQKPGLSNASLGLLDTFRTLLVALILLFNAYGLGNRLLRGLRFETQAPVEHLLLVGGIGLGLLGLLGLLFSAAQLANEFVLIVFQLALAIFFFVRKDPKELSAELKSLSSHLNLSSGQYGVFTKLALLLPLGFSFLLTFVPPFEAFDALLYHLAQPARILQDGGLRVVDVAPHFWFPNLTENVYLWTLGMGSERAAQMIHFAWALLSILLVWHWAGKVWNIEIARKALLLLAAMPALPVLASWAYADMALVYYAIAALYAVTQYRLTDNPHWLSIAALMAGFAMSVKYTSFVVPVTCAILLLWPRLKSLRSAARFSLLAIVTALPYYARNAILMQNPFYPFVFGGRYWDAFRSAWFADSGTGIGWNAAQLIALPLNAVLGHRDANFFDGRMGPLFLILAPVAVWILLARARRGSAQGESLLAIGVFCLLSVGAWTLGVVQSAGLWQTRLLFPALVPLSIPTALAWDSLHQLDISRLRVSFLVRALIAVVLALTIIDNGIFVLQRNPLAVALGAQSREQYIQRVNPSYAALMKIVDDLPAGTRIYSLFEPRSYGLPRFVHPDPINDNFAHDVYLYRTPETILEHWKSERYTYLLVYERGREFMSEFAAAKFTPELQKTLQDTLDQLNPIGETPDRVYSLYQIP